jgi:hypothetical protein
MSKAKAINLQIPSNCSEDWNSMTPKGNGRHCSSCQKTVVDFTTMSDSEIYRFFEQYTGSVCGRLLPHQLERDISSPQRTNVLFKYLLPATLPVLLLGTVADARLHDSSVPTAVSPVQGRIKNSAVPAKKPIVKGRVLDQNGAPVRGASILVKDTHTGTSCNELGVFELQVQQLPVTLVISSVGYVTKEVAVRARDTQIVLDLKLDDAKMGEIVGIVVETKRKKNRIQKSAAVQQHPSKEPGSFLLYPNPVQSGTTLHLRIQNLQGGEYNLELTNLAGQLTQRSLLKLKGGGEEVSIVLNDAPPGVYLLQLTHKKSGVRLSQQLVIK